MSKQDIIEVHGCHDCFALQENIDVGPFREDSLSCRLNPEIEEEIIIDAIIAKEIPDSCRMRNPNFEIVRYL